MLDIANVYFSEQILLIYILKAIINGFNGFLNGRLTSTVNGSTSSHLPSSCCLLLATLARPACAADYAEALAARAEAVDTSGIHGRADIHPPLRCSGRLGERGRRQEQRSGALPHRWVGTPTT